MLYIDCGQIIEIARKGLRLRVEAVQAVFRADPERPASIFVNRHDRIIAETVRIIGIMAVKAECPACAVEGVQTVEDRADPEHAGPIFV